MEILKLTCKLTLVILVLEVLIVSSKNECIDFTKFPTFHLLPQGKECGVIAKKPKILGGEDTSNGELPFMAHIVLDNGYGKSNSICGGTIISKRYILTAAHCVDAKKQRSVIRDNKLAVGVGDHDTDKIQSRDSTGLYIPVSHIILPPEYVDYRRHDIALLRLARDITFNKYISPVCLPLDCKLMNQSFEGESMLAAGWGRVGEGTGRRVFKPVMQKIWLPVTSQAVCETTYGSVIMHSHICVGGAREHGVTDKKTCTGDSGGPLVYPTRTSGYNHLRYVQMGVTSFGDVRCRAADTLGASVFTRVTSYVGWILSTIRQ